MTTPLPPGATIGILGGGQLGRMAAVAAAQLGYKCHIYSPDADAPAKEVSAAATTAPYEDTEAARAFAHAVDVVTFEFENVPDDTLAAISESVPVRPGVDALHVSQDRAIEKSFLNEHGIGTAPWAPVTAPADMETAGGRTGFPAILKTSRFGYDGKGQVRVNGAGDLAAAWDSIGNAPAVLEGFVDFEREISVIVARGIDGATQSYVPVDNVHRDHILYTTTAPSTVADEIAGEARRIAADVVTAMDLVGLLAVEMFVLRDGHVLVNEIAPRPHNSGHWTLDACAVSQFEQFIRAVAGLPLGDPSRHSDAVMTNLIGDEAEAWAALAGEAGACLHLYGKAESRPGRKMGHVTRLSPVSRRP
ncbi:MAG: 5-(carboxyamino)imidazole ribonucleotide synthase [Alphaproteobacteria bacterium]